MKQVRTIVVASLFIIVSLLFASRYEAHSDTTIKLKPYLTGPFPGEPESSSKPDSIGTMSCFGCAGCPGNPQSGQFGLVDSAGSLYTPRFGSYTPEDKVDDLVDDYFDGEISYEELEHHLDEMGWGLDPLWGPYPYPNMRLVPYSDFSHSPSGCYGRPDVHGIQYERFTLINPQSSSSND